MTTDDGDEREAGSEQQSDLDSDPDSNLNPDSDSDSSTIALETESGISLVRAAILVSLAGAVVGSTLPWVSITDLTVYGFETYGLATIAIATATGALVYASDWSKRAMAATFVAGLLISSMAFVYVPFGGIGPFVTLASGIVLAFMGLVGYDNRR